MANEDLEKALKEQLLNLWKNNAIFRDNIAYLSQVHLRSAETIITDALEYTEDLDYQQLFENVNIPSPPRMNFKLLSHEETFKLLLEKPKSFCRYGDGEFTIMLGRSISFQKYDKKLDLRLKEILKSSTEKCYVALMRSIFHSSLKDAMLKFSKGEKNVWVPDVRGFRKILTETVNRERVYIEAGITTIFPYYNKQNEFMREKIIWFENIKNLFKDRKLAIFSGSTVFNKIKYNVFEKAKERIHIFADSKNAWSQYEAIMNYARRFSKDWTLCFILGPTATVVAYDLAQEGYMAWDIGHVAKLYDSCMKDGTIPAGFFDPD